MIETSRRTRRRDYLGVLLDHVAAPVFAVDEGGKIVYVNAAAGVELGRQKRYLVGKPFPTLVALDDRRAIRTAIAKADAIPVPVDVTLEPVGARRTAVIRRMVGVEPPLLSITLVSEAPIVVQVENRTPKLSVALDRFFLRFQYGVIGLDATRRITFANPRARALLGDPELRLGKRLADGPVADFADRVLAVSAVAQTGRLQLGDGRVLRASGLGPRGSEPAVLILEDVTAHERHEQVMREFLRNAAHQLRTPLTGIATAVEVLQAGAKEVPPDRDRFLGHVEQHARRLIRIARGLLVLARAQSGGTLRLEFVEVRPLLEELSRQARPVEGVRLAVDCQAGVAVLGERDLLQEALASLLENAVAHTASGKIDLDAVEHNGTVSISVTDSGGGILPEHRDRIFEPFYRGAVEGEGFGLGLAIASQAVQAMSGRLSAEGAEGGTRFVMELPSARLASP